MIAIDHHPRPLGTRQRRKFIQHGEDGAGIEQDMAGKYQIKKIGPGPCKQAVRRYRFQDNLSGFHPARHLPAKAMKLAIGGQHPDRPRRNGGQQAHDKIMRVGSKAKRRWIGQV